MDPQRDLSVHAVAQRIGEKLVAAGKITPAQADTAASLGQERNLLFGQVVVILGFVSPSDVEAALAGTGEGLQHSRDDAVADVAVLSDITSPQASDFRRLAQNLALRWFRGELPQSALSIISADRKEGRTTVATNLACSLARAGVRTLLIDADLHNPTIHTKFGLKPVESAPSSYYSVQGLEHLTLLPASTFFDVNHEKFMRSALTAIIDAKSAEYDVIFVDTPAASVSSDYLLAGLATKGAIVVTREGVTKARSAAKMLNSCEDVGIPIVGGMMLEA